METARRAGDVAVIAIASGIVIAIGMGSAPGARAQVDTEIECSLVVRPVWVDPGGARVRATPDRFLLEAIDDGAVVRAAGDAWQVRAGSMRVAFRLIDRVTGAVVLEDTAALACGRELDAPPPEVIPLVPQRAFRGSTMTRSRVDHRGSCGGHGGPEQWYRVTLDHPSHLGLRLVSEFDAAIYVREGSIDGPEIVCRDHASLLETVEMELEAGTYFVAVDGTGAHGRYRLVSFEDPIDPRALDPIVRAELVPGAQLDGELVRTASRYEASCGGTLAPEHVYALRIDRPSLVAVSLESRFDAALYLVSADGSEIACQRAAGLPHDLRLPSVTAELAPGIYYVIVDGESGSAGVGRYHLAARGAGLLNAE